MATETEISAAFEHARKIVLKAGEAKRNNRRSDVEFSELFGIAAFLLEGFLIDVHRIAEAQKRVADNTTLPDINESGWTHK